MAERRARASRRRIGEMSAILRSLLDDLVAAGGPKARAHRDALDLVDAFARGGPAPDFAPVRAAIAKVNGRMGFDAPPLFVALAAVPVELLMRMVEQGDDLSSHVLQHAARAVVGEHAQAPAKRIEELAAEAARRVEALPAEPLSAPAHELVPEGDVGTLDLPPIVLAHLMARRAARTGKHATSEATAALLVAHGHAPVPELLSFEAAYGGLELLEEGADVPALVVGPYALLSSTPKGSTPPSEPAPLAVASNDVYYGLDAEGRGVCRAAMVEGTYRASAPDARGALSQAILWRAIQTQTGPVETFEGARGEALAAERALSPILEASGETERWWGDMRGMRLVVEVTRGNGYSTPMTYACGGAPSRGDIEGS